MKMKVQKAYFKKVILLLLLLSGGMNFSFSVARAAVIDEHQELSVPADFIEQLQDLLDGSRPAIVSLNLYNLSPGSALPPYQYLSSEEAKRSAGYIRGCRAIEPALDATDIIYPFHYFL